MESFAEVIPIKKLPKNLDYFDYSIPSHLEKLIKKGQLVKIPWKKFSIQGIIFNIKNETEAKIGSIKPILEILEKEPVILPFQLKLAFWLAKYYHVSLTISAKMMHYSLPKKKHKYEFENISFPDIDYEKKNNGR